MIRIAITPAACTAIATTLALGTVAVEPERAQDGGVVVKFIAYQGSAISAC